MEMTLQLVAVERDGSPCSDAEQQAGVPKGLGEGYAEFYVQVGYEPPWVGYLACEDGVFLGTCGFKGPPRDGLVEIAYFTFPEFEGHGIATCMASELVRIAHETDPAVVVTARTLPVEGASTAILRKLGFTCTETVEDPEDGPVWHWVLVEAQDG